MREFQKIKSTAVLRANTRLFSEGDAAGGIARLNPTAASAASMRLRITNSFQLGLF